jgi:hypothetical protein
VSGRPFLVMCAATLPALASGPASAQTVMTIELGASQVGPPSGLEGENARFGMAGMRLTHYSLGGSGVTASLMFGQALGDPTGGDFTAAVLGGALRDGWGSGWSGSMDLELVGFQVSSPFPYRAFALEGGPSVSFQNGLVSFTGSAVGGVGRSRVEVWRVRTGPSRVFEDDLWRVGGTGELSLGSRVFRVGVNGGVHESAGGTYKSGGARIIVSGSWGAVEARADIWETPLAGEVTGRREVTGGLVFVVPMSGWSMRGFLGKSEPDPLTLAEPGSGGGGILLGRSIFSSEDENVRSVDEFYEVVSESAGSARVRIAIEAPRGARSVALLGDFTLWDPIPMRREGSRWVAELDVVDGSHHYGFLVNDEWYLPDDARDVVPDEWGRLSAILVIEGAN